MKTEYNYIFAITREVGKDELNKHGIAFGGFLMGMLDGAAYKSATMITGNKLTVTAGATDIKFYTPGILGSMLDGYSKVTKVNNTSVAVHAVVKHNNTVICEGSFTFVAIDKDTKKPTPIDFKY